MRAPEEQPDFTSLGVWRIKHEKFGLREVFCMCIYIWIYCRTILSFCQEAFHLLVLQEQCPSRLWVGPGTGRGEGVRLFAQRSLPKLLHFPLQNRCMGPICCFWGWLLAWPLILGWFRGSQMETNFRAAFHSWKGILLIKERCKKDKHLTWL